MSEPEKSRGKRPQPPSQQAKQGAQQAKAERRKRRRPAAPTRVEPTSPRWAKETGPKICQKCGGRMFPADWIWQKYGLCLGWRCANCKERVMARSLPFKGLRKRALDPDEVSYYDAARAAWKSGTPGTEAMDNPDPREPLNRQDANGGRQGRQKPNSRPDSQGNGKAR